jgi:predicted exporter
LFVPSAARQAENRDLLYRALLADRARLQQAFDRLGFRRDTVAAMERAYWESESRALTPEAWLASAPAAPFRHLWLGKTERGYGSAVVPHGFSRLEPLADAAAAVSGVSLVDKAGSVSRLFREYRTGFSIGLAVAALVVLAVLSRRYGLSGAGAVMLPSLLGMTVALGVAGHAGVPVTLFSVMALMLVLGVGVNYSIFLVEGGGREGTTLVAVLLSAATTLLSFGLLAFSGTPALARFGATLLAGIGAAVLLAPLALTFSPQRRAAQSG